MRKLEKDFWLTQEPRLALYQPVKKTKIFKREVQHSRQPIAQLFISMGITTSICFLEECFNWRFITVDVSKQLPVPDFLRAHNLIVDLLDVKLTRLQSSSVINGNPTNVESMKLRIVTDGGSDLYSVLDSFPTLITHKFSVEEPKYNVNHRIRPQGHPVHSRSLRLASDKFGQVRDECLKMKLLVIVRKSCSP
ncbi:hypothetical protein RF11_09328 [Thelohanellus kitauei]|uniref:Uncharacterized protein n=1 Tax=Thelohanellus kitauei TaxID=669202 RepID=A0A0C2MYM4_THEKT|nr:hypothetical protein RF11_09328 [Thelohanellus kitauei]